MTSWVTIWLRRFCLKSSKLTPCSCAAFSTSSMLSKCICLRISSSFLMTSVSPAMPMSLPFCTSRSWSIRSRSTFFSFSANLASPSAPYFCFSSFSSWSRLRWNSDRVTMSLLTRATISSTTVSAVRGIASNKAAKSANTGSLIKECGFIYFIADYRQAMYRGTALAVPKSRGTNQRDRHWNEVKAEGARSKRILSRYGKYHVLPHSSVGTGSLLLLEEFRPDFFQRFLRSEISLSDYEDHAINKAEGMAQHQ